MAISAPVFWFYFSKYDAIDKELDDLDRLGHAGGGDVVNSVPTVVAATYAKEAKEEEAARLQ
jgi:hypothetical protein